MNSPSHAGRTSWGENFSGTTLPETTLECDKNLHPHRQGILHDKTVSLCKKSKRLITLWNYAAKSRLHAKIFPLNPIEVFVLKGATSIACKLLRWSEASEGARKVLAVAFRDERGASEGAEKVSAVAFGISVGLQRALKSLCGCFWDERGASAPRKSQQIQGALAPGSFASCRTHFFTNILSL